MNQSNVLDAENLLASCTDIKKTTNTSSILFSGLLLITAGLLLFFSSHLQDHSSSLYMGVITISVMLVGLSAYRFLTKRSAFIYIPTQSSLKKDSIYFDIVDMNILKKAMLAHNWEEVNRISLKQSGNARIDYLISNDRAFVAVQFFQYIPYKFEPTSEVLYFDKTDAQNVANYLTQNQQYISISDLRERVANITQTRK